MENPPAYDRSLLIPVGVGIFSLIGICGILVWGRINATRAAIEVVPTATVFQYALIGTEPAISTGTLEGVTLEGPEDQELPTFEPEIPTSDPVSTPVQLPTNTLASVITLPPLENTPTRTPTSASTAPFGPGTFDNTDSRFVYSGGWDPLSGVAGAYQNTLHVSDTLLSSVTFRFIGNELRVFFQSGPSLGSIRVSLDGNNYEMSEAGSSTQIFEWVLSATSTGTHTVTITHLSGGSVNFDSIIVPVVSPTPTSTATPTNQ